MGRQITNPKTCPYTICLVCEGEKTEPYFFLKLVKDLETVPYELHTDPQVVLGESAGGGGRAVRHLPLLSGGEVAEEVHLPYPLNFVEVGRRYLDSRIYNEVWVVYDKDNHPAHAEAWASVIEYRRNVSQKLNLVFSSRCIEYYFLEHFEYINRPFEQCECKARDSKKNKLVVQNCCRTDRHHLPLENACDGVHEPVCINGYARHRDYWAGGAGKSSDAYDCIGNLWVGIINAHRLKWQRLLSESPKTPIYEYNPYLNTYRLALRLHEMASLEHGDVIEDKRVNGNVIVERKNDVLTVKNQRNSAIFFGAHDVKKYRNPEIMGGKWDRGKELPLNLRRMLQPGEEKDIYLSQIININEYLIINMGGHEYFCALEGSAPVGIDMNRVEPSSYFFTQQ